MYLRKRVYDSEFRLQGFGMYRGWGMVLGFWEDWELAVLGSRRKHTCIAPEIYFIRLGLGSRI